MHGRRRQQEIYLDGVAGRRPRIPADATRLEERARERMSHEAFEYVAGGAGIGRTVQANRDGFDRWRIAPRMLRDVSERDLSVELLGRRLPAPLMLCPVGVLDLAHRHADRAVARAAASTGVPLVLSNQASTPMEEVAAALGGAPWWFQLYWSTSNELVESLVRRAEAAGAEAIAVTLDTTLPGWRTRDLDVAYLPFLRGRGIAQYTSDPVFSEIVARGGMAGEDVPQPRPTLSALRTLIEIARNHPERFGRALRSGHARAAVQTFVTIFSRPSLTWDDLPFLRDRTRLPIVLKGIMRPDDARRAVDAGMDAVWVSNHGGRQVDGSLSTIEALPPIVEAVGGRVPIVLDSGVRTGADVFKALALGATAVGIGRPYVYALAIAGEAGVRELLANLQADLDLTMGLAGCRSRAEVGPEMLA